MGFPSKFKHLFVNAQENIVYSTAYSELQPFTISLKPHSLTLILYVRISHIKAKRFAASKNYHAVMQIHNYSSDNTAQPTSWSTQLYRPPPDHHTAARSRPCILNRPPSSAARKGWTYRIYHSLG